MTSLTGNYIVIGEYSWLVRVSRTHVWLVSAKQSVRSLRQCRGLSRRALSETSGVPVRTLQDLERGLRRRPHRATSNAIASALRVPIETIGWARDAELRRKAADEMRQCVMRELNPVHCGMSRNETHTVFVRRLFAPVSPVVRGLMKVWI